MSDDVGPAIAHDGEGVDIADVEVDDQSVGNIALIDDQRDLALAAA
ncbi:hypothetical protein [Streptomyces sp. NRRL S-495]|nr:hypothetical protein [Streptomyces sp. NRRL S-495]